MVLQKRSKKAVLIVVLVMIIIGILVLGWFKIHNSLSFGVNDIESVEVKTNGLYQPTDYCEDFKFIVAQADNIKKIFETVDSYDGNKQEMYKEHLISFVEYKITFHLKDGSKQEYNLQGDCIPYDSGFKKVLVSEEVVPQIRTAFTIDTNQIFKVEYYHWEEANKDRAAIKGYVRDEDTISEIIEVAQMDVLANPEASMESTDSGFTFYNKDGDILLGVRIYPEMEGYNRLAKVISEMEETVQ